MAIEKIINIKVSEDGTDQAKQKLINLNKTIADTSNENKNLVNTQSQANKSNKDFKAGLDDVGGGFSNAISGAKGLLQQFKLLLTNPIILIITATVGALTLLYKAFVSTNDGADKMEQITKGLNAVVEVARDRFLKFGEAMIKVLKGDFKGAMQDAKESIKGFGAEVEKEFKQASESAKLLQEVEDATRNLSVSRAKLNRDLAESKNLINEENASYKEKIKALDKVKKAEGEQTEKELENARKKLKAISLDNQRTKNVSDEKLKIEADAEVELLTLQEKSFQDQKSLAKVKNQLTNEENQRVKELNDKKKTAETERLNKIKEVSQKETELLKEKFNEEKISFENQRNIILNDAKLTNEAKQNLLKEINKSEKEAKTKNKEEVLAIEMDYKMKLEDMEATTELAKIELEEKRAKEKLSKLKENKDAEIELEKYYTKLKDDLKFKEELEKKELDAENENLSFEERLLKLQEREQLITENTKLSLEDRDKLLKENNQKKLLIEEELNQNLITAEENLKNAKLDAANFTTQLISQIAGKNKSIAIAMLAVEKGLAIAQIVSSAGKSIAQSTANLTSVPAVIGVVPNPMFAVQATATAKGIAATKISAATSIASILSQTIQSAKGLNTSSSESGSSSGGSISTPPAPPAPPSFNLVQGTGSNQIAQSLARDTQPLKAYVVASEVTTQQSLERNIKETASI